MSTTSTRLITLIMLLQRRPRQKAGKLADELGVSERTVHRYFGMLDDMGIPVYSERGPHGGFSLVRGYKMPPLVFTPEEAVAVYLGIDLVAEIWGPLYGEAALAAQAKLDNVLPDEQRGEVAWANRTLRAKGIHRNVMESVAVHLVAIRNALRYHRCVELTYRSRGQVDAEKRRFDVYALVYRWGWWYAVGYCHLRDDIRFFRVDRIESIDTLDTVFEPPTDFDIEPYLADQMFVQPGITMRMRFHQEFAFLAWENRAAWDSIEAMSDGSVEVTLSTPDSTWATSTALSYGGAAVVLAPLEVREQVRQWAEALVAQHS